ncbi:MAG TPA: DsbE family thiol:disulfide interchange protein [Sphingomicrobium sp.]|nr:DsbE family thiol:disulfide interchange protein [Sphingomicrobium sp.]
MSRALRLLPIILIIWILIAFAWRLVQPSDSVVRSHLVNREVPPFTLPSAVAGVPGLDSASLATGEPRLVNFFASWCVPCVAEAPILERLKKQGVKIDGIAVRDTPGGITAFLDRNGNPYERIGADRSSRVQLSLGSSGVPETFVVDGKGVIRFQFVGPIGSSDVPEVMKQLEEAK